MATGTPLVARAVTEADIDRAETEKEEVERLAAEEAVLLEADRTREGVLQQQLADIERDRFAAAERLLDVSRALETAELEVFDIKSSISQLNQSLARETDSLSAHVRSLYKAGRATTLETVLASNSFSEALDRATSLERALSQDQQEVETLRLSRQAVQLRTVDLAARLQEMDKLWQESNAIHVEFQRQSQRQQDLIVRLQRRQATYLANIAAFRAEAAVIGDRIVRLQEAYQRQVALLVEKKTTPRVQSPAPVSPPLESIAPGTSATREYVWPLRGFITAEYGGCTVGQCPHVGLDIAADFLAPVVAAGDGVVLKAGLAVAGDRTASYGMIVMIAHSQDEVTLYAHLDDRTAPPPVAAGDFVTRGQLIGYLGETGWTTGPHLHFEYRVNGAAHNPVSVLP